MTHISNRPIRILAAFGIGAVAMLWSGEVPKSGSSLVSTADARIGRPATPMSYAGSRDVPRAAPWRRVRPLVPQRQRVLIVVKSSTPTVA